jgi:hypothetical protein
MFNKINDKILWGLFAVLLLVAVYLLFFNKGEERSFRKELVSIDTSKVSEIYIYPKNKKKEIHLVKEGGDWRLKISGNKTVPVPKNKVVNVLNELVKIEPNVLAARDKSKWHEFQVDTTGIQVKVLEGGKQTLNIIIGRIAFQQPRSVSTYVRLSNDVNVYKTDGYAGMSFNRTANDFRNNNIISGNKNDWISLTYQYPSDSSFILSSAGKRWRIGNTITDSAKTVQLLNNLQHVSSIDFVDDFTPGDFRKPDYKLLIDKKDTTNIQVDAYLDSSRVILHSSENPESYFNGTKNLNERIFLSANRFLKKK